MGRLSLATNEDTENTKTEGGIVLLMDEFTRNVSELWSLSVLKLLTGIFMNIARQIDVGRFLLALSLASANCPPLVPIVAAINIAYHGFEKLFPGGTQKTYDFMIYMIDIPSFQVTVRRALELFCDLGYLFLCSIKFAMRRIGRALGYEVKDESFFSSCCLQEVQEKLAKTLEEYDLVMNQQEGETSYRIGPLRFGRSAISGPPDRRPIGSRRDPEGETKAGTPK